MSQESNDWQKRASATKNDEPAPILMPDSIWQILRQRGITGKDQIENFVNPKLKDLAHPFSLDQMDVAVERLIEAFVNEEAILIYGDYDLDGTPGLALLQDALQRMGFANLHAVQPQRLKDGYGLHASLAKKFVADHNVSLVLTVDVGISDVEAVRELQEAGVDVIITDHHLPKEELPPAIAIVNPNKGTCGSTLQHLCGTGVAFYLILALRMEFEKQQLLETPFNSKELLDLFALATITDMVPLVNENRVLVKHGLKMLAATERPGLKMLLSELGMYGRDLNAQDVGFRLAPKLNALTRLEAGVSAFSVLTATPDTARGRVDEALHVNEKRRELQDQARDIVKAQLAAAQATAAGGELPFLFVYSHEFHPGVISLIASELMQDHQVPAFVGAIRDDGRMVGSARAPEGDVNLQTVLNGASQLLTKFGGHKYAAGFEIAEKEAEALRAQLLDNFANVHHFDMTKKPQFIFDAELSLSELSSQFMTWYEALGPFGMGFEAPSFLIRKLKVRKMRMMKNKFMRYTLSDGLRDIEAPWFQNPIEFQTGAMIDAIVEPQWNEYQGRRTLQMRIQTARLSQ